MREPQSEPRGSEPPETDTRRLDGVELQLAELNAQVRSIARWIRFREGLSLLTRIVGLVIAIMLAAALAGFFQDIRDRIPAPGTPPSLEELRRLLPGFAPGAAS